MYSIAVKYYAAIGFFTGVFPLLLIGGIYAIKRWPFDPPSDFELRRMRMGRDLKKIMDSYKESYM